MALSKCENLNVVRDDSNTCLTESYETMLEALSDIKFSIFNLLNNIVFMKFLTIFESLPVILLIFDEKYQLIETNNVRLRETLNNNRGLFIKDLFEADVSNLEKPQILQISNQYLNGKYLVSKNSCELNGNGIIHIYALMTITP